MDRTLMLAQGSPSGTSHTLPLRTRVRAFFQASRGWVFAALVAALVISAVGWGLFAWQQKRVEFDDAYISYRYAYNLVHGHGLVFNPGERVEGYTNFLWVLLAAAAIKAHLDPFSVTRAIGVCSYLAMIALIGIVVGVRLRKQPWHDVVVLGFLSLLILPYGFAALAGSGLETPLVSLLILAVGVSQHLNYPRRTVPRVLVGGLPLLACLTRPDAFIAVASSALACITQSRFDGESWRRSLGSAARRFSITGVGLLLFVVWRLVYYHDFLPNSYYAKAANQSSFRLGGLYLLSFVENSPQVLVLLLLGASALITSWRSKRFAFRLFLALTVAGSTFYIAKVGGDFMYYRFAFETYPLLVLLGVEGLLLPSRPSYALVSLAVLVGAASLSLRPPVLETKGGMQSLDEMDRYVQDGRRIGEQFAKVLPPETRIATTLAGTIPYYSRLFTIDQWGINDRTVARLPGSPHYRGHVKLAPEDYLRARGVNLFIHHPVICYCSFPCRESLPNVFVRLDANQCLRTWYMVQTDRLTKYFCAHPEWFVLNNIRCPVDPTR